MSVCAAQLSHWLRCPWPQDSLPVHPVGDWWLEINAWLETCRINRIDLCNHPLKRCCWWPSRSWILKKSLRQIIWSVLIISSMSITFCVITWGIQPIRRFVMFCVQWEASSSIISKPLITQKDINELRKAQTKNSRKLDKHAQTSSSGFAKKYTRFQFIVQCLPGLEWDHEGKTCSINIPPETPTAWLVLSGFNLHFFGEHCGICVLDRLPPQTGRSHTGCWAALCTQVQVQWHNLNLKSFGFSPKVQGTPTTSSHETVSLYHHHILSHDVPSWQQLPGSWAAQSTHKASGCMVAFSSGTSKYAAAERIVKPRQSMWHCVTVNDATHWNLLNTLNSSICSLTWEIEIMYSIVCRLYHERFNVELLYHCTMTFQARWFSPCRFFAEFIGDGPRWANRFCTNR